MKGRVPKSFNTERPWGTLKIVTSCNVNFKWHARCKKYPECIVSNRRSEENAVAELLRLIAIVTDR